MATVKPALEAAGAKYLIRGSALIKSLKAIGNRVASCFSGKYGPPSGTAGV